MSLERLIKDNPQFHQYEGTSTSWAVHPDTLRFLYNMLTPGMSTLETGCGHTTVIFSMVNTKHICITPDQGEAERVQQYCAKLGLAENITFIIESSDTILPQGELIPSELDFIFIDGAHRFPIPVIDWYYTAFRLKLGGIVSVDDFKIPSVKIVYDFLSVEEEWELIKIVYNTAFFRKLQEPKNVNDWGGQKINLPYRFDTGEPNKKSVVNKFKPSQLIKKLKKLKG